ncbi:DDB1- and CUL4-associated factor 6-like isoform X2 [Drosophila obscura]|uniref:DDB1- and CUL4-associated factor 6-like isoform X2 n=1 Tax=Drosophila obscura TaxID=7282 RepID=UPI000BA04768|nr:DDB1- and CUL4-associated factor 6-like isoform X2 [Drosophila obscura]
MYKKTAAQLRHSVHQSIENYPYNEPSSAQATLQASCKNSLSFVQRLDILQTLYVHNGCVNTVNWNASGTHIVSGSDDNHLVITEAKSGRVALKSKTQHKRHIFSARFMPHSNDQAVVSCSGEGLVIHTEFLIPYSSENCTKTIDYLVGEESRIVNVFDCHTFGSTFDVLPIPDEPRSFLSCGEDATVRCFDLRQSSSCSKRMCQKHILIMAPCAVTAMDVAPFNYNNVAIGCSDSIIRLYDRRMLANTGSASFSVGSTIPLKAYPIPMEYTRRHYRPTCVKFNINESELLVSYSMEQIYLFDLKHPGYNDAGLLKSGCYTPKMRREDDPDPQMPRLRFRGDWSDTGPNSQAIAEQSFNRPNVGQARPPLEPGVLSRLSDEIFRMLNSPSRQMRQTSQAAESNTDPTSSRTAGAFSWQSDLLRTTEGHSEAATSNRDSNSTLLARDHDTIYANMINESDVPNISVNSGSPENRKDAKEAKNEDKNAITAGDGQTFPIRNFDYVKMAFSGHRNSRTMVKGACFWGDDFIMSGSDCGHIFVWNRQTGKVVKTLLADNRVVNRVQPHPTLPYLLSSGIDYNVKVWAPIAPDPHFDEVETAGLIKSNEIMLVETRDTITVPAQIMIRILASLHQYRRLMHEAGSEARSRQEGLSNNGAEAPNSDS